MTYWIGPGLKTAGDTDQGSATATFKNMAFSSFGLPGIGVRYNYIRSDGFGVNFGGRYEFPRRLAAAAVEVEGSTVTAKTQGNPQLSLFVIEPNVTYYLDRAYLFLGPNFTVPVLTGGNGTQVTGAVGGQIGLGWDWGHNISNIDFGKGHVNFEVYFQYLALNFQNIFQDGKSATGSWPGAGLRWGLTY